MERIWMKIPNYSLYEASNMGEIKTFNWKNQGKERIMKPALDGSGYLRTMLVCDSGKTCTIKVHRIIAQTFTPNPENKPQVNHLNGIKTDNRLENLEWCTLHENLIHAYKNKLATNKGENNPCATLSDSQVLEIRANFVRGNSNYQTGKTRRVIAKKYNTSFNVIKKILTNQTWKHLL